MNLRGNCYVRSECQSIQSENLILFPSRASLSEISPTVGKSVMIIELASSYPKIESVMFQMEYLQGTEKWLVKGESKKFLATAWKLDTIILFCVPGRFS